MEKDCDNCFWCEKNQRQWRRCIVHVISWQGKEKEPSGSCPDFITIEEGILKCPFRLGIGPEEFGHGPCNQGCKNNGYCSAP